MQYCLSGQMLQDHCCCDSRHGEGKIRSALRQKKMFDFACSLFVSFLFRRLMFNGLASNYYSIIVWLKMQIQNGQRQHAEA